MPWVTKSSTETYAPAPPPREYTRQEKARNWWHYHKWMVLGGVAAVLAAGFVLSQTLFTPRPDVRIGYISERELPPAAAAALQQALVPYAQDCNGDGRVMVEVEQYVLGFTPLEDPVDNSARVAGITRLTADLNLEDGPYILLMEDPQAFQRQLGALARLDGSIPGDDDGTFAADDWEQMVLPWTACPVLAGLDLGNYEAMTPEGEPYTAPCQEALAGLYVGRRAVFREEQADVRARGDALWQALTAGAVPAEEGPK